MPMGNIYHEWNGTVLTVTSDSGTSSADLKGAQGDMGVRGAQGIAGGEVGAAMEELMQDMEAALDSIIAIQNELIGGEQ